MKYEAQGRTLKTTISVNGTGDVTFLAENVRYERTGVHAKVAILHNATYLDYDVFNVDRSEDRRRLVLSAQRQFGKANAMRYGTEIMKADLDRFCLGLEVEWQRRIPMTTLYGLVDDTDPAPPPFLAWPLILAGQPNLLFGERSSAKSLTATILVVSLLLPPWQGPFRLKIREESIRSLWLDWEWGQADIQYHIQRLCRGHRVGPIEIAHQPMIGPLSRNVALAQRLRQETKAEFMICDSVTMASGVTDLNKPEGAIALYDSIREIGGTWLLLAHTSKDPLQQTKTAFGSQVYESQARNVWECVKTEPTGDTIEVGLFHRKSPPFTGRVKPLGYRVEFIAQPASLLATAMDPRSVPEWDSKLTDRERILQALRHGSVSRKDLAGEIGLKPDAFRQALKRLRDQGRVQERGERIELAETRHDECDSVT